jgi:hypothetical protein
MEYGGRLMKIGVIKKGASFFIGESEKYLYTFGARNIHLMNKSDLHTIACFKDIINPTCIKFVGNTQFIAKTTSGLFKIYDLEQNQKQCLYTIKPKGIQGSQDTKFVLSPDKTYVIDVLNSNDEKYFYRIDWRTGDCERMLFQTHYGVIKDIQYDDSENRILVLETWLEPLTNNQPCIKVIVSKVDPISCKKYILYEAIRTKLANVLYSKRFFVTDDMKIVDYLEGSAVQNLNIPMLKRTEGYYSRSYFSNDYRYYYVIYSSKVIIYNMVTNKIANQYHYEHCSSALIVNKYIYIGTWNGLFCLEFIDLSL